MIAEVHHWDEHIKLVNLVTKLCGQAYSFYRSCDGRQRSCYVELVETTFHIPYRTKLWRGENFGEFGESPQFAKFFCQHSR